MAKIVVMLTRVMGEGGGVGKIAVVLPRVMGGAAWCGLPCGAEARYARVTQNMEINSEGRGSSTCA